MKRILAAAALAAPLALVPSIAFAGGSSGGSGSYSSVSINQYADFDFAGALLDVGLLVKCSGGTGLATVSVDQDYPETWAMTGAHGTGVQDVVCDGRTHSVGVTIASAPYDAGKAYARATVTAPSGDASASRWITIRVV